MSTQTIPSDFLSSPTHLNRFVSGDEEKKSILRSFLSSTSSIQGRTWSNSPIDFDELYYLASGYFLTLASYLLYAVCLSDLSKKVWVKSRHTINNALIIKTNKVFQDHLLAKSVNTHRLDSSGYFLRSPAKTDLATHPTPNTLNFFHKEGICRGMCHWFVHLYFKTSASITNTDQHLKAVGKQFEQGAPAQAAFLHSLDLPPIYKLLALKVQMDHSKISTQAKSENQIIVEFQKRPPGVYGIYTSTHQVVYIKVDELRQYLFDPNIGVVKITSPDLLKNAMQRYLETHDSSKEISIDLYTPS